MKISAALIASVTAGWTQPKYYDIINQDPNDPKFRAQYANGWGYPVGQGNSKHWSDCPALPTPEGALGLRCNAGTCAILCPGGSRPIGRRRARCRYNKRQGWYWKEKLGSCRTCEVETPMSNDPLMTTACKVNVNTGRKFCKMVCPADHTAADQRQSFVKVACKCPRMGSKGCNWYHKQRVANYANYTCKPKSQPQVGGEGGYGGTNDPYGDPYGTGDTGTGGDYGGTGTGGTGTGGDYGGTGTGGMGGDNGYGGAADTTAANVETTAAATTAMAGDGSETGYGGAAETTAAAAETTAATTAMAGDGSETGYGGTGDTTQAAETTAATTAATTAMGDGSETGYGGVGDETTTGGAETTAATEAATAAATEPATTAATEAATTAATTPAATTAAATTAAATTAAETTAAATTAAATTAAATTAAVTTAAETTAAATTAAATTAAATTAAATTAAATTAAATTAAPTTAAAIVTTAAAPPCPIGSNACMGIDEINVARAGHGGTGATFDEGLTLGAQEWANQLFADNVDPGASSESTWRDPLLVNSDTIAELVWIAMTPPLADPAVLGVAAAQTFYQEKDKYNHETHECVTNGACDNYTQMMWQGSTQIGIGVVQDCDPGQFLCTSYVVIRFSPPGNVAGEYPANVLAPNTRFNGLMSPDVTLMMHFHAEQGK